MNFPSPPNVCTPSSSTSCETSARLRVTPPPHDQEGPHAPPNPPIAAHLSSDRGATRRVGFGLPDLDVRQRRPRHHPDRLRTAHPSGPQPADRGAGGRPLGGPDQ